MFQAFWMGTPYYGARPGDMDDPERALPHGRKLVQPFPGEDPPQDEVTHLERPEADTTTMVPPQHLVVFFRS